ncbi:MAG: class I SAM-dependent methyltransferase [Bdellovibrionales bacterium]|nr:class I SAM-dependent methyltransferase [Oligoflexia bacterium]
MLRQTTVLLRCVSRKNCGASLKLETPETDVSNEVNYGTLVCVQCKATYPIVAGVAIVVPKVREYFLAHVKGITKYVPDAHIPKEYRKEFIAYRRQIEVELTEADLESDRVNALYLMNHYLSVKGTKVEWWKNPNAETSPIIESLVHEYWDEGPFSKVHEWLEGTPEVVELGCGVGGLLHKIRKQVKSYLGVDNAFHSVILARHFNLGTEMEHALRIPADLLQGTLSEDFPFPVKTQDARNSDGAFDFIVGEIESPPLPRHHWDVSISLNTIDMLEEPKVLPQIQKDLIKSKGFAIQSGPYIWNDRVSKRLRSQLPKDVRDSATAVEWLYTKAGFEILKKDDHVPWLFFKHGRQIELYSVQIFLAHKLRE